MTLKIGQRWRTRGAYQATVEALNDGRSCSPALYPFLARVWPFGTDHSSHTVCLTAVGMVYCCDAIPHNDDLITLLQDAPQAMHAEAYPYQWPDIDLSVEIAAAEAMPTPVLDALAGIGDVTSTEKGSGARYNAGKTPFELVPLHLIAASYIDLPGYDSPEQTAAVEALDALGAFQISRGNYDASFEALYRVFEKLGFDGWAECAQVFDYGRRKYAEWNWAKGMQWSVVIGCAARHLKAMIDGEQIDIDKPGAPGSQLPHRGHVFCNVVMLLIFMDTFEEGDDRAAEGLLSIEHRVGEIDFERKRPDDSEGGAL